MSGPTARVPTWAWVSPADASLPGEAHPDQSRAPAGRRAVWVLERRGVRLGGVRRGGARVETRSASERWRAAEPVHVPGMITAELRSLSGPVRRTAALFDRLREGSDFAADVVRRLGAASPFRPMGSTVDLGDPREIEKVHADHARSPRAEDLYAKLSWISTDERDPSMRIRFSFGSESLDDWKTDPRRARAADLYAEAVFPECRSLSRHRRLFRLLRALTGGPARLSERIVFSNAPGGGAVFHHDAETDQLGVVYGQLTGRTAWLALPKTRLATLVHACARGALAETVSTPARALRALERHDLPALDRLLNRSPRFTRRLVEENALIVLRPGDVLLLPSHDRDRVCWHSVFALGRRPGVAHSYGIFRASG